MRAVSLGSRASKASSSILRSSFPSPARPLLHSRPASVFYTTYSATAGTQPEPQAGPTETATEAAYGQNTKEADRYRRLLKYVRMWSNHTLTNRVLEGHLTSTLEWLETNPSPSLEFPLVVLLIRQASLLPPGISDDLLSRSLKLLPRMTKAPLANYNQIIYALAQRGELQGALLAYKCLRDNKLVPGNYTLSALLLACTRNNRTDAASRLFKGFVDEGVIPNTRNYNCLLAAYGKNNQLAACTTAFEQMKAQNVPADHHTFNILVQAATSSGDIDKVVRFYEEMVMDHPEIVDNLCSSMLAHVIRSCGNERRAADALRLFDLTCSRTKLTPDVIVLSAMVHACCVSGDTDTAFKIFNEMESVYRVAPNLVTYGGLIRGLAINKRLSDACKVHKEMMAKKIGPNLATYNALFEGAAREGQLELALDYLREMEELGVNPNPSTITCFFAMLTDTPYPLRGAYARTLKQSNTKTAAAAETSETDDSSDVLAAEPPDPHRLMQALQMATTFSEKYGARMDRSGLFIILQACIRAEEWEMASQAVSLAKQHRLALDETLDALIAQIAAHLQ